MIKRIIAIAVVVILITSLLLYSQKRNGPVIVSGYVEADEIRVGSRVGGRVQKVIVEEGQAVKKDQKLIILEPYDLVFQEKEVIATVASSEAELKKMKTGFRPEEIAQAKARYDQLAAHLQLLENGPRKEEINAAKGRKEAAQAELSLAEQNYKRSRTLYDNKSISKQEFDSVEQKLISAKSMLLVRTNELELLESGTREEEILEAKANLENAKAAWQLTKNGYREEDIAKADSALKSAQAALSAIQVKLKELTIISPVDGTIEALELESGDLIAASAPVLSIMDHKNKWIRTYVPENRMNLKLGQTMKITVDSFPKKEFSGEISFISRQAEFTPSNVQTPEERSKQVFRIKITLNDNEDLLKPGMPADVWLEPIQK